MAISTAIDPSAAARALGLQVRFVNLRSGSAALLPQRVALIGQGATASTYSTDKREVTSADDVGARYGYGSPLHLAARQLLPANGDGIGTIPLTVYPQEDAGSAVAAAGTVVWTPAAADRLTASFRIKVNEMISETFVVNAADDATAVHAAIAEAINAVVALPVTAAGTASEVTFTAKWAGTTGNSIYVEIEELSETTDTFAVTQATGGLVDPSVQPALDAIGGVWETMVLTCIAENDVTNLDRFSTWNEGRWLPLEGKPAVVFRGNVEADVSLATTTASARRNDRTNVQVVAPGSRNLPFVVAARQLARVAARANTTPPRNYGSMEATGIVPGTDAQQWDYRTRDIAIKAGSSTATVQDGVVQLADIVTHYRPEGETLPPYRHVVDIVKLQNLIFETKAYFMTDEWDGAPLIPDGQPSVEPTARSPQDAVAGAFSLIDDWAARALISDPESWKANTVAEIDATNPKRLNLRMRGPISGNVDQFSIDLEWGFFFGVAQAA